MDQWHILIPNWYYGMANNGSMANDVRPLLCSPLQVAKGCLTFLHNNNRSGIGDTIANDRMAYDVAHIE